MKPTKEFVQSRVFEMLNVVTEKENIAKKQMVQRYAQNIKLSAINENEVRFAEGMFWGLLMCLEQFGIEVERDFDEVKNEYTDEWLVKDWGILED